MLGIFPIHGVALHCLREFFLGKVQGLDYLGRVVQGLFARSLSAGPLAASIVIFSEDGETIAR